MSFILLNGQAYLSLSLRTLKASIIFNRPCSEWSSAGLSHSSAREPPTAHLVGPMALSLGDSHHYSFFLTPPLPLPPPAITILLSMSMGPFSLIPPPPSILLMPPFTLSNEHLQFYCVFFINAFLATSKTFYTDSKLSFLKKDIQ